jgi:DNA polymerase I
MIRRDFSLDDCVIIDFEFRPRGGREGNLPEVICMVALEVGTGIYHRLFQDELYLLNHPPFPLDSNTVIVSYFASAEMSCFNVLNWNMPENVLDLYAEYRNRTNGLPSFPGSRSLLGAMKFFGLDSITGDHKDEMRLLALRGGPYNDGERLVLLEYCQSDVDALLPLLKAMLPEIDQPRALIRGRYNIAVAAMEATGTPIDLKTYTDLCNYWNQIREQLILEIDSSYGVYKDGVFKSDLFEKYLRSKNISWPRTATGKLKLDEETFKDMAKAHPVLSPLRSLRDSLAKLRLSDLHVGSDGRNRCLLSQFSSITGRNQPSTTKFVFGLPKWLRGLIKPEPGKAVAYIDWSQQEFGIAASLSKDINMISAYSSGDPYLAFAKQAGAVPQDATKYSHPDERNQYKQCVLATQYGMGPESLATKLNTNELRAKQLLAIHRRVYHVFWAWSDNLYNATVAFNKLSTLYGWQLNVQPDLNPRSLRNFPMQANAAEMLRLACILMYEKGIAICAPVHDAVLIEASEEKIDETVLLAQQCMEEASSILLGGFKLTSEVRIIRNQERFHEDTGQLFWDRVMRILEQTKKMKTST